MRTAEAPIPADIERRLVDAGRRDGDRPDVSFAYLFGGLANGHRTPSSDVDGDALKIVRDGIDLAELKGMAEPEPGGRRSGPAGANPGNRDAPGAAMTAMHRELAAGRWFEMPLVEQMANVGSEIERTITWRDRNARNSMAAFERGLELLRTGSSSSSSVSTATNPHTFMSSGRDNSRSSGWSRCH